MADNKQKDVKTVVQDNSAAGAVYGLGIIGGFFYAFMNYETFWGLILDVGAALFWPAVIVYKWLEFFRM